MKAGEKISADDLIMKRPGDGISPMKMDEIIGRTLNIDVEADHKLTLDNLV